MTLIYLAVLLAFMVAACVFITWDIRTTFRKAYRYTTVDTGRAARRAEDQAWAEFLADADARRRQLEQTLQSDRAIDRLRHMIDAYVPEPEQTLRVVA